MFKFLNLLIICLLLFSCSDSNKQNAQNQNSTTPEKSIIGRNNYAVVWHWTTLDKELVIENTSIFTKELLSLWEKNDVENIYFDTDSEVQDGMHFPSISFFVKANNLNSAKSILNELTIVEKGIAQYKLYPVGMLWLGQTQDSSKINKNHKSFVTIWETKDKQPVDNLTKAQNDTILALWNKGKIQNVYFDIEGVINDSKKTDFVFYIRASNLNDAEVICKSLPFYQEDIASYRIFSAGAFWLGVYDNYHKK